MINIVNRLLRPFKYSLKRDDLYEIRNDIINDREFMEIYNQVKGYTMTSIERMFALYKAVQYVADKGLEGDFIECGVWRGGSSMIIAHTLKKKGINSRHIYMYDTYEGMSAPSEKDKDIFGDGAAMLLQDKQKRDGILCFSALDEAKANMQRTGYPMDKITFVQGKVEETIPQVIPGKIALLRLDTDWYESTLHELKYLYPLLCKQGVLIIDDYGHWQGARKAVDEYFGSGEMELLNRIDYTGRIAIKS